MEVRVGFFGICISPDNGAFICNANATALAEIVTVDQDPLNVIWLAERFKDTVVFPYLMWVLPRNLELKNTLTGILESSHLSLPFSVLFS